ncbi:MAG: ATPase, partial [Clostridia bacterium]|nr:ATPase [Clostridia bacterium]
PAIETKAYGGKEYKATNYTMSELVDSIYEIIEKSGCKQGILFLDEINCVAENLDAAMLKLLQYKMLGQHKLPDGWIIVAAGNPPEYNRSARNFDIVTWDRLRRIDVEPDYDVWKEYAYLSGVHPAITTYLDIKKHHFYSIETTVTGKPFVTARGWSDLSALMNGYEQMGEKIDEKLIRQFIQQDKIAKSFAEYYDLWNKSRSDYNVNNILSGKVTDEVKARVKAAKFDERLSLIGLMLDAVSGMCHEVYLAEQSHTELLSALKQVKVLLARPNCEPAAVLQTCIDAINKRITQGEEASNMSNESKKILLMTLDILYEMRRTLVTSGITDGTEAFKFIKKSFDKNTNELKRSAADVRNAMSNMFAFCEEVFREGQEMLIIVTELTVNFHTSHFISRYGCDEYFGNNKELLLYERQKEITIEHEQFDLGDLN